MVKTKFFVHCGWKDGGYENTHYHKDKEQALKTIDYWNTEYKRVGSDAWVELISCETVSEEEFIEDYCGID